MSEVLDLIYEVYKQIDEARSEGDLDLVSKKQKELDQLRSDLVKQEKSKGMVPTSEINHRRIWRTSKI